MWRQKSLRTWHKYSAEKTQCRDHSHPSKLEAKVCGELHLRKLAGDIKDFKTQVDIPLVVNGIKVTTYRADFLVDHGEAEKPEIVEAKGMVMPVFALKWKLLEALHSEDYTFTVVKKGG